MASRQLVGLGVMVLLLMLLVPQGRGDSESKAAGVAAALHSRLAKYNKNFRPGYGEEAVNVSVSVSGLELVELNEREMVLRLVLAQSWTDPRLAYQSEQGDIIRLGAELSSGMWQPDTVVSNGKVLQERRTLLLRPSGSLEETQHLSLSLICRTDLTYFPLESQLCGLTLTSLAGDPSSLQLMWGQRGNSSSPLPSPLSLLPSPAHLLLLGYRHGQEEGSLQLHLLTQRRILPFLLSLYLPACLLLLLPLLSLLLPTSATNPRLLLTLPPLLLLLLLHISSPLPSSQLTAGTVYLLGSLLLSLLALLHTLLIILLKEREGRQNRIMKETQGVCRGFTSLPPSGRLDAVARILLPLAVVFSHILYWQILIQEHVQEDGIVMLNSTKSEL